MEKFLTYNNKILKLGTKILFEDIITPANVSGGIITYDGDYTIHTFTGGTDYFITDSTIDVEYLIVAGGGGGGGGYIGYGQWGGGAGGGAGGLLTGTKTISAGTYTINVGSGGAGGAPHDWSFDDPDPYYRGRFADDGISGQNSSAFDLISIGGGGGARGHCVGSSVGKIYYGLSGGSGGGSTNGSSIDAISGGTPVDGQGYTGGGTSTDRRGVGGGGGASQSGQTGGGDYSGSGGTGYEFYSVYYAGGGGGANVEFGPRGIGGIGGGGDGGSNSVGGNGIPNTGGGAGGGGCGDTHSCFSGGTGGSGIVIIRHLT